MQHKLQTLRLIGLQKTLALLILKWSFEDHIAGSVYKEEIPYMASRCVYNGSVQDVQPLPGP